MRAVETVQPGSCGTPISMPAEVSVASCPARSLPACWSPARVVAPEVARARAVFRPWAGERAQAQVQPEASQPALPGAFEIDAGDKYPRLRALAEQISQEAAVVPVACEFAQVAAAEGLAREAVRSDFPGSAE